MPKRGLFLLSGAVAILAAVAGVQLTHNQAVRSAIPSTFALPEDTLAHETTNTQLERAPRLQARIREGLPNEVPADSDKPLDEPALLSTLHELGISDPPLSLKLARQAVDRFPDSSNAPEFEWNVVKSLFNMQRIEDAKQEAQNMVWKYPNSDFTRDVERHLLHPQPDQSTPP